MKDVSTSYLSLFEIILMNFMKVRCLRNIRIISHLDFNIRLNSIYNTCNNNDDNNDNNNNNNNNDNNNNRIIRKKKLN